jgi:hypothetical protein
MFSHEQNYGYHDVRLFLVYSLVLPTIRPQFLKRLSFTEF